MGAEELRGLADKVFQIRIVVRTRVGCFNHMQQVAGHQATTFLSRNRTLRFHGSETIALPTEMSM